MGAGGDAYRIGCAGKKKTEAPKVAVIDKTGKTVLTGSFGFG